MRLISGVPRSTPVIAQVAPEEFSAKGLHVAVIGGTGGLGRAIALYLAEKEAQVITVGRTFRDEGTNRLTFIAADLESHSEARRIAEALPVEDLDALILTSGTGSTPKRQASTEGIERDLAISYISRFVLLHAVAARIGVNRPRRPRVFVMGFPGTGHIGQPDDLNADKNYDQLAAHMNTVAGNEALVLDAAQRFPRLAVFGLNPGIIKTDIRANVLGGNQSIRFKVVETLIGLFGPSPRTYAERIVPVLFASELEGQTGFHFNQKGRPIQPSEEMTPARVSAFTTATERLLEQHPAIQSASMP